MACGATLKRTMDFDPLMNPTSPKRRRCIPVSPSSSSSSPRKYLSMEPSPFGESSSRLSAGNVTNVGLLGDQSATSEALATCWSVLKRCFHIVKFIPKRDSCCFLNVWRYFLSFVPSRTNPQQHQAGVQTHSKEEASRWRLPTVRVLLFSRVPVPVVYYECFQHARLVK